MRSNFYLITDVEDEGLVTNRIRYPVVQAENYECHRLDIFSL